MNTETDDETAQCPYCDGIFRGPKDTDPLRKHLNYCFSDEDWEQLPENVHYPDCPQGCCS